MYLEILVIGIISFVVLTVNGYIKPNKFIQDNQDIFLKLKEEDYDFLVRAKYGDGLDSDVLYQKRIKNGLLVIVLLLFLMLKDLNLVKIVLSFVGGFIAYFLAIPSFLVGKEIFTSYEEVSFTTSFTSILLSILVLFFTSLLASGICMALSGKAKTYKEAQSSLQFVSILPIIPYFISIMEVNNNIFQLIPIANCSSLLNDIVINKIQFQSFGIIIFSTIVYIICILKYISLQYSKEETLFS